MELLERVLNALWEEKRWGVMAKSQVRTIGVDPKNIGDAFWSFLSKCLRESIFADLLTIGCLGVRCKGKVGFRHKSILLKLEI